MSFVTITSPKKGSPHPIVNGVLAAFGRTDEGLIGVAGRCIPKADPGRPIKGTVMDFRRSVNKEGKSCYQWVIGFKLAPAEYELEVVGFSVHVYGVDHALIHRDIPLVVNTGFLVEAELFHPGDSYTVPEDPVNTLLLPISAPWLKAGEMIDYFRAVGPARGYAIHDAILNDNGLGLMTRMMSVAAAPSGAPVARLEPGTSLEL